MLPVILFTLAAVVTGFPLQKRNSISGNDLVSIDSRTSSCNNAPAANECRTAAQAASLIDSSFTTSGINDFNTQAALVALMLYETAGFKYSQNHYPGVPGQGTRNMQSPTYNSEYARYLATVPNSGVSSQAVQTAQAQGPAAVLALVNVGKWSFASAAWFLTTHCSASIRQGLAAGTQAGWQAYLTQCVGTTSTDDRTQLWVKAIALKQWASS